MRYIFRYDEAAKKHLSKLLKKKLPDAQPWLHVAVKTVSNRNPWSGATIYVWDTRQVVFEHRQQSGTAGAFDTAQFHVAETGMHRAIDNRQPLIGGRKDINEFFEFGDEFDASRGSAFNGADRVKHTPLSKRRAKKSGLESELSEIADKGGKVDLSKYDVDVYLNPDKVWYGIVAQDDMFYLFQDNGTMITLSDNLQDIIDEYQLTLTAAADECFSIALEAGGKKYLRPDEVKAGMTGIDYAGETWKIIKVSKNFNDVKRYDTGAMQEALDDGEKPELFLACQQGKETAVFSYDYNSMLVLRDNKSKSTVANERLSIAIESKQKDSKLERATQKAYSNIQSGIFKVLGDIGFDFLQTTGEYLPITKGEFREMFDDILDKWFEENEDE